MASLALYAVGQGHDVHLVYSPDRVDQSLIDALKNGGVKTKATPMRRSIGLHDAIDGVRLNASLRSLGPLDVIHSHSSKAGALARVFGRVGKAAHIYSPHGFYTMTGEAPSYIGHVERALSVFCDRIVAVSAFEKEHAVGLGIDPAKVTVVENGVAPYDPMPSGKARSELGLDDTAFVAGFVGRLAAQKDPLAALNVIDETSPGCNPQLAIIGDGELRSAVEARAAMLGKRAVLVGPRPAQRYFSAFDVLLCTSRYEGMSVAFLEALNCGIPIVTYPVGGASELVLDGRTGFVAADPAGCARRIEQIAAMPTAERARMTRECRKLANAHTDATMGEATLRLYKQVLSRPR